jgi:hypothetical protein
MGATETAGTSEEGQGGEMSIHDLDVARRFTDTMLNKPPDPRTDAERIRDDLHGRRLVWVETQDMRGRTFHFPVYEEDDAHNPHLIHRYSLAAVTGYE